MTKSLRLSSHETIHCLEHLLRLPTIARLSLYFHVWNFRPYTHGRHATQFTELRFGRSRSTQFINSTTECVLAVLNQNSRMLLQGPQRNSDNEGRLSKPSLSAHKPSFRDTHEGPTSHFSQFFELFVVTRSIPTPYKSLLSCEVPADDHFFTGKPLLSAASCLYKCNVTINLGRHQTFIMAVGVMSPA